MHVVEQVEREQIELAKATKLESLVVERVAVCARDQIEDSERIAERILVSSRPVLPRCGQELLALAGIEITVQNCPIDVTLDRAEKADEADELLCLHDNCSDCALALVSSRFLAPR
ncbi:MAG TPA: hypothetical protein VEQ58_16445 [Polyangiaceae bacterium]|nr:hypothetical protein [Polyangiaceae bacterium]